MRKQKPIKKFVDLAKEKKKQILLSFSVYFVALCSIGIVNYPYIDDTVRRLNGRPNFGLHYSRWGSEFFSWLFQGTRHLTDQGLMPFILSALILTATSFIIQSALLGEKINYLSSLASVIVGLNPWFLNAVAFRFDGPLISLSLLSAVVPFIWWKDKTRFGIISVCAVFLMYNFYQASSGVFFLVAFGLLFLELLRGRSLNKVLRRLLLLIVSFMAATFFYLIQLIFLPATAGKNTEIMRGWIVDDIFTNLTSYIQTVLSDSTKLWKFLIIVLLILFVFSMRRQSRVSQIKTFGLCGIFLLISLLASFGIYSFLESPISTEAPRYNYGFGVWLAILCVLVSSDLALKTFSAVKAAVVIFFTYQIVLFVFVFSSMLQLQKDTFISQSNLLRSNLMTVYLSNDSVYLKNGFFRDSEVLLSAGKNYPILRKIVPSNAPSYFPNKFWFKEVTNISIEKENDKETLALTDNPKNLAVSNDSWDIYKSGKKIIVVTK
ncbi:glucosyltransferase domain-containing protein [Lactovum odontotermitis]